MKLSLLLAAIGLVFATACVPTLEPIDKGDGNPVEFTRPDINGNPVSLSDFRGKVVIVEFWASWCGPCRAHKPRLRNMWDTLQTKDVQMIGISLDRSIDAWKNYVEAENLTWVQLGEALFWNEPTVEQFGINATPTFIIFDQEGNRVGGKYNFFDIEPVVAELLGETAD